MDSSPTQGDSAETQQKSGRRPQFSLRVLLLLLLLAALPLSWIAARRRHAVREDTAIEDIREIGGVLSFYGREDLLGWKSPLWLLELTGSGPRAATLWFPEPSSFNDNDVELLLRLDPLPAVSLHNTRITDRGLETLARHPGIQRLDLKGTAVTNVGLQQMAAMSQLTSLDLRDTQVTHSGLECVGRMPNLRVLELSGHLITDRAIEKLSRLQLTWIGAPGHLSRTSLSRFLPRCPFVTPTSNRRASPTKA